MPRLNSGTWLLWLALQPLACGGSQHAAGSREEGKAGKPLSKGEECLKHASTAREPKQNAPESIGVSHILVRHAELERPSGAKRTREAACLRAMEALEALKSGVGWSEAVQKYSDAPGTGDGSLGKVSREELDPAFANAAFALDVDELSYVVESQRGFHVILRRE